MATDAYIGQPFVFQVTYLDDTGQPIAVTGVNLTLFVFNANTGVRTNLVSAAPMAPIVPPMPSRYYYGYTIPPTLDDGTPLYAEYRATSVLTGFDVVVSETLNLHSVPSDLGLRSRFVR